MKKIARIAAPILLILFWTAARTVEVFPLVYPGETTPILLGNDPWFHLHQSQGAVENFPHLLRWDVGSHYPNGIYTDAAGLFNVAVAFAAKISTPSAPSQETIVTVLAWSPIAFGMASLVFLFFLGRELGGYRLGLAALFIRVLLPGEEIDRTILGFGDNHAPEIMLATLGLWLTVRFAGKSETRLHRRIAGAFLASLPWTAFLYTWFGAPLHIAVLAGGFWIAVTLTLRQTSSARLANASMIFLWILVTFGLLGWLLPELVMKRRAFGPTLGLLGLQSILCAVSSWALPRSLQRFGALRTFLAGATIITVTGFLAFVVSQSVRHFVLLLLGQKVETVSEHLAVGLPTVFEFFGPVALLTAFGIVWSCVAKTSFKQHWTIAYILIWTLLWWISSDYGYLVCSLLSLPTAIGILGLLTISRDRIRSRPKRLAARGLPVLLVAITLVLIWPMQRVNSPVFSHKHAENMLVATRPWREAMTWMKSNTPTPLLGPTHLASPWKQRKGFDYPEGSYGVLTHWQFGNLVNALAGRLVVSSRFSTGKYIEWFLEPDEEKSREKLEKWGDVRYVVLDGISVCESFPTEAMHTGRDVERFQVVDDIKKLGDFDLSILSYGDEFRAAVGAHLYLGDGLDMSGYRLVYESPSLSFLRYRALPEYEVVELKSTIIPGEDYHNTIHPLLRRGVAWQEGDFLCYSGTVHPSLKIFESVKGATIHGNTSAKEDVALTLELTCPATGRSLTYTQETTPNEDGAFEFRVPYSTGPQPESGQVRAQGNYIIRQGSQAVEIAVPESVIQKGEKIPVTWSATPQSN